MTNDCRSSPMASSSGSLHAQAVSPREDLCRDHESGIEQQRQELLRCRLAPTARELHELVLAEGAVAQDVHAENTHGLRRCSADPGERVPLDHRAHVAELAQPPEGPEPLLVDAARAHDLERRGAGDGVEREREAAHRAVVGEPDRENDRDAERDAGNRQRRAELLLAQAAEDELPKERHVCAPPASGPSSTRSTWPSRRCMMRSRGGGEIGRVGGEEDREPVVHVEVGEQCRARGRRSPSRDCRWARPRRAAPAGERPRGQSPRAAARRRTAAAGKCDSRCATPTRSASARAAAARSPAADARQQQRQRDVLAERERRQQVEELEHEAHALAPHARQPVIVQRLEPRALERDRSAGRTIHAAAEVQKRGLAAPGRPDERHEVAGVQ